MPNDSKEWWQEMVESARLLQLQKTSFPSGDMENWVSQKELIEFFPKLIAEATRRGKVEAYQEIKTLIDAIKTEAPYAHMVNIDSVISSRIQQYGTKE